MSGEEPINLRTIAGWSALASTCILLVLWLGILALIFPIWLLALGWKWFVLD